MKNLLVLILLLFIFGCEQEIQKEIHSSKRIIQVLVNERSEAWIISPQVRPDRLKVYCSADKNEVVFQTDLDTAIFYITKNDTIRFQIILNNKDTAYTEIVGIRNIPNTILENDKIYALSRIWSEIKYNFVNMDHLDMDIDSLYQKYLKDISETKTDYEFYQTLKRFVSSFKDGHTAVWDNSQFYEYQDYFKANLLDVNDKVYIASLRKCIENDSSWVGAELISILGIKTKRYLKDSIFPYISASTDQHLWMQGVYKIHQDFKWKDFDATIVKRNGDTVNICLPRNGEETRSTEDEYWGRQVTKNRDVVAFRSLQNNISYLNIRSFYPDSVVIQEISEYLNDIYKSNGLIIDLRYNGGGSTEVAWYLQSLLSEKRYFLNFGWETRINDGVKRANSNWKEEYKGYFNNTETRFVPSDTIFIADTIKRIKIPTLILISRYTFSAAEDFLINLYEVPNRPLFIGQETAGSTGSPLVIQGLPGGGICRICTRRVCFPYSGKPFVNQGIKPDIEVIENIYDLIENRDIVLEKALELISIQ